MEWYSNGVDMHGADKWWMVKKKERNKKERKWNRNG